MGTYLNFSIRHCLCTKESAYIPIVAKRTVGPTTYNDRLEEVM